MTIKHKTQKQAAIRLLRIEAPDDPAFCRTMVSIWHRRNYLIEGEKEKLESIIDRKEADYEPLSN